MRKTLAFYVLLLAAVLLAGASLMNTSESSTANADSRLRSVGGDPTEVIFRRIPAPSDVESYYWRPSPDGRLLSFVDWSTGDLALYDLQTRKTRRVTDKGPWSKSENFAEIAVFSQDGRRLAYAWCCEPEYSLRVINTDGSGMRVLYPKSQDANYMVPLAWSPNDKQIFINVANSEGSLLMMVSTVDGSARTVKKLDRGWPYYSAFSPDGRYVAYDEPGAGETTYNVYIMDLKRGREVAVTSHAAHDKFLAWTPDGKGILFSSDRSGTPSLWVVATENGISKGDPRLVRRDVWGVEPIGYSAGKLFHTVTVEKPRLQTATVDVATGRILAPPRPQDDANTRGPMDWSPDGRYLAYLTRKPGRPTLLVIRPVSGGEGRELTLPERTRGRWIYWTPDGKSVLFSKSVGGADWQVFKIDLKTGATAPVLERKFQGGSLTSDGRSLYKRVDEKIVAYNLKSGEERVVHDVKHEFRGLRVSRDGKMLAAFVRQSDNPSEAWIRIFPVAEGRPRDVLKIEDAELVNASRGFRFTPDGKYLLFVKSHHENLEQPMPLVDYTADLVAVSIEDGSTHKLMTMENLRTFNLNPDGKRIALIGGQYRGELWVMENLSGVETAEVTASRR